MSCIHVADRLTARIQDTGSIACVGLDPRPALLPPSLREEALNDYGNTPQAVAAAYLRWGLALLEAIHDRCACIKPQLACYEAYGSAGLRALEEIVSRAHQLGVPTIIDGKRGDIGSTATHYRQAYQGWAPGLEEGSRLPGVCAEWQTVNAYMGTDAVTPFLGDKPGEGGIFVLVRTSNPGAADLQDQPCGAAGTVMERMGDLVRGWGEARLGRCGLSDVGAVMGATWPEQARALRKRMPHTLFLVPGYGAQGGSAADALAGARADGSGVIVNASRSIIGAWQNSGSEDYPAAARAALEAMNADLATAR